MQVIRVKHSVNKNIEIFNIELKFKEVLKLKPRKIHRRFLKFKEVLKKKKKKEVFGK